MRVQILTFHNMWFGHHIQFIDLQWGVISYHLKRNILSQNRSATVYCIRHTRVSRTLKNITKCIVSGQEAFEILVYTEISRAYRNISQQIPTAISSSAYSYASDDLFLIQVPLYPRISFKSWSKIPFLAGRPDSIRGILRAILVTVVCINGRWDKKSWHWRYDRYIIKTQLQFHHFF